MKKGFYISDKELSTLYPFPYKAALATFSTIDPDTIVGWIIERNQEVDIIRIRRPIVTGEQEKIRKAVADWFFYKLRYDNHGTGFFDDIVEVMLAHGCNIDFEPTGERSL